MWMVSTPTWWPTCTRLSTEHHWPLPFLLQRLHPCCLHRWLPSFWTLSISHSSCHSIPTKQLPIERQGRGQRLPRNTCSSQSDSLHHHPNPTRTHWLSSHGPWLTVKQMVAPSSTSLPLPHPSSIQIWRVHPKKNTGTITQSLASSTSLLPTPDLTSLLWSINALNSQIIHDVSTKMLSSTLVITCTSPVTKALSFNLKPTTHSMPMLMPILQDDDIKPTLTWETTHYCVLDMSSSIAVVQFPVLANSKWRLL